MDQMKIYPASESEDSARLTGLFKSPDEMAVAAWVRKNRHKAGATTDTLPAPGPVTTRSIKTIRYTRSSAWNWKEAT